MTDVINEDFVIRPEVAQRLGHYVYLYIDPRNNKPFYVGKGQGDRVLSHLSEAAESRKCARIAELRTEGKEPRVEILAHALRDEETAFRIEAAVIDGLGAPVSRCRMNLPSLAAIVRPALALRCKVADLVDGSTNTTLRRWSRGADTPPTRGSTRHPNTECSTEGTYNLVGSESAQDSAQGHLEHQQTAAFNPLNPQGAE